MAFLPRDKNDPAARELDGLVSEVYDELHRLAASYVRGQRPGHTLQTTALVHEAYLRLSSQKGSSWRDRRHFYCVAAKAMRQILTNYERDRRRLKRGGGRRKISLEADIAVPQNQDLDLMALDAALEALTAYAPRKSQIVELRYFVGLTVDETAKVLGVSPITVKRDWALAKAWLLEAISEGGTDGR